MSAAASRVRAEPAEGLQRRALPALIFVAAMAVAVVLAAWSMRQNAAERQALFERRVEALKLSLASVLRSYLDILPALRLTASGPAPLTDLEFKRYGDTVLGADRFPGLAISFIAERVPGPARERYLARVRGDRSVEPGGHPGFDILPAGARDEHVVLRHQYPADPPTEGYDLFDPGQRYRAAVEQAIDAGGLVATGPLQLARDRDQPRRPELTSIVVRAATYRDAELPATVDARRLRATGVVGIGFRTRELVLSALPPDLRRPSRVRVTDPLAPPDAPPLFDSEPGARVASAGLHFELPVANRRWHVEVLPAPQAWWEDADASTFALLLAGLISALSLSVLTAGLSRARRMAEARVRDGLARLEQEKAQLAHSETRLRLLFENSFDAVLNARPDGQVLSANPTACTLFGMSEAALTAAGRNGLVDADDPRLAALLQERQATSRAHGQIRMRRGDGSLFEAEISSVIYRDVDGSSLASLIVRDLSAQLDAAAERERLEGQLRHAQKMEAVGTLAGGIAHDFNNLLAVVLGGTALLADELGAGHPAQAHVDRLRQAGLRGRSLVQRLLTFSRPSAEGRRPQALQPLVEEALALLRVTLPATVRLVAQLTPEPLMLLTEASQMQQILINLCTNAWQAMPGHKGLIEVGLAAVDEDGRRWACLSVSDDGTGMDAATRVRIFEPFFSTKASGQGSGLGLAMVHGIVTGHGGRIDVRSAPGAGTRFDVWLPLASTAEAALAAPAATPHAAPAPGRGQRVLYLDDDEVLRLTVEALLTRQGYRVELHAEPATALGPVNTNANHQRSRRS
jgi:PAS domain S-box-containing protein